MSPEHDAEMPARAVKGRVLVTALAVLVVLLVVALGSMASEPDPELRAAGVANDPSAVLDDALADGTPVYVLIHSLT